MPNLYRRRYIPDEKILLKDDIVSWGGERIVTSWRTIRPRTDFDNGYSCYMLKHGVKVNRFMKGSELYLNYIDIGEYEEEKDGSIVFHDLLLDVAVGVDGSIRMLDLDELANALQRGLVSQAQACSALHTAAGLLQDLYAGNMGILDFDWGFVRA